MASAHHSRVGARKRTKLKQWSGKMTRESHALPLEKRSTRDIAVSLKRATKRGLKRTLGAAKGELRKLFA
jgi:hypothetical protein